MSPEENFNPEKEPEPYDLWFLSSTRDQTQDTAAKFFLSFRVSFFLVWFFFLFFLSVRFFISVVVGKESAPQTFFFVFLLVSSTGLRRCQGGVVFIKGDHFWTGPKNGLVQKLRMNCI
jgi:hypothetical protein